MNTLLRIVKIVLVQIIFSLLCFSSTSSLTNINEQKYVSKSIELKLYKTPDWLLITENKQLSMIINKVEYSFVNEGQYDNKLSFLTDDNKESYGYLNLNITPPLFEVYTLFIIGISFIIISGYIRKIIK